MLLLPQHHLDPHQAPPHGLLRRSSFASGDSRASSDMCSTVFSPRRQALRRHSTRATRTLQPVIDRLQVQAVHHTRNSSTRLSQARLTGEGQSGRGVSTTFRNSLPYRKKAGNSFSQQAYFGKEGRSKARPFNGMSHEAQHAINETRRDMGLPLLTREETRKLQRHGTLPSIHRTNGVASRNHRVAFAENIVGGLPTEDCSSVRENSSFYSSWDQADRNSRRHLRMQAEKTFEISPAGFDSRFNEMVKFRSGEVESTTEEIMLHSVAKCNEWLTKYS